MYRVLAGTLWTVIISVFDLSDSCPGRCHTCQHVIDPLGQTTVWARSPMSVRRQRPSFLAMLVKAVAAAIAVLEGHRLFLSQH